MYSLNQGNQTDLIYYAVINQDWLNTLNQKYSWDKFDQYDNKMWEYMYKLFDDVVENSNARTSDELWIKLNRSQKLFWSFLAFGGDTDNGGVYQFFFNKPQHTLSVLEVWEELGEEKLATDYKQVLNELLDNSQGYKSSREFFNNEGIKWEERCQAFQDGKNELPAAKIIEEYYYDKEFRKSLFKKMTDYIDKHIHQFAKIK